MFLNIKVLYFFDLKKNQPTNKKSNKLKTNSFIENTKLKIKLFSIKTTKNKAKIILKNIRREGKDRIKITMKNHSNRVKFIMLLNNEITLLYHFVIILSNN